MVQYDDDLRVFTVSISVYFNHMQLILSSVIVLLATSMMKEGIGDESYYKS